VVKHVYGFGAAIACWAALVIGFWFFRWAGDAFGRWALALLLAPLAWFVGLVVVVQAALWAALLPANWLRLERPGFDRVACGLLLAAFSLVSCGLLNDTSPAAHFLGWLWWAGLLFCLLVHWVAKTDLAAECTEKGNYDLKSGR
jgi:hypothetical protein